RRTASKAPLASLSRACWRVGAKVTSASSPHSAAHCRASGSSSSTTRRLTRVSAIYPPLTLSNLYPLKGFNPLLPHVTSTAWLMHILCNRYTTLLYAFQGGGKVPTSRGKYCMQIAVYVVPGDKETG